MTCRRDFDALAHLASSSRRSASQAADESFNQNFKMEIFETMHMISSRGFCASRSAFGLPTAALSIGADAGYRQWSARQFNSRLRRQLPSSYREGHGEQYFSRRSFARLFVTGSLRCRVNPYFLTAPGR